jgi:thiol:disulfide interchange protein DsbD
MTRLLAMLVLATAWLCASWPAARAMESAPASSSRAQVTLVTDTDAVAPGTPFRVGLRLRLAPGWHTYWVSPGDAGIPPNLELSLPAGATAGPIGWPAPERLAEGSVITFGYTGEVVLPVTVTPAKSTPAADGAVVLRAHADWLVCEKICVPESGDFRLDLPAGTPAPSPQAALFAAADRRIPRPSPFAATIAPDGTLALQGAGIDADAVASARFIPRDAGAIDLAAPQRLRVHDGALTLALKTPAPLRALSGVVEITDRSGAMTGLDVQAAAAAVSPEEPGQMPFGRVLGFALLGGLLLNLMPCVFPILAMKAMALASWQTRGTARLHALSYAAGVLVMFAALGAALIVAHAAGSAVGWGFQFQSPPFVAATAWLLFGVGLNLSGVFSVGGGFAGAGQSLAGRGGHAGSFFTGLLAVLVATPCTAPFMGVAIAAALAATPAMTMLVFLTMGAGLAAPYVLLAAIPALARATPRPGRWMIVLQQALAFPMYAAAAWLVWVLSQQSGPAGVLAAGAGLVLVGFAAWAVGIGQSLAGRGRRIAQSAALAAMLAAIAVLPGPGAPGSSGTAVAEAGVEPFSAARLDALRAEGRTVFVNMTAAWCVTCLVNERLALAPESVRAAFAAHHVAYLKGDWTRQNPEITRFLQAHGRDGVPLYAMFRPGSTEPEILPQILTERAVLDELARGG